MKKILLLLLFTTLSFSQDLKQLKLTPKGVEPIVVLVDSLKANEIYNKTLNWVQEAYKNPNEVLKTNIINSKIRVDGYANNAWYFRLLGMKEYVNMEYSIIVSIKDGKYRLEFIIGQFWLNSRTRTAYDYTSFFKQSGEIRSMYSDSVPSLELTINKLSMSLYNYINEKDAKKNDW